jgi:hypothetical protein
VRACALFAVFTVTTTTTTTTTTMTMTKMPKAGEAPRDDYARGMLRREANAASHVRTSLFLFLPFSP